MNMNRRHFVSALAVSALSTLASRHAFAALPRVVVVGGGMAGATLAKYLRLWSNKTIDVTIVEPNATYVSNIMSNLAITGQIAVSTLNYTYANLTKKYGIKVVKGVVTHVSDPVGGVRTVTISNGATTSTLQAEKSRWRREFSSTTFPGSGQARSSPSCMRGSQAPRPHSSASS